MRSRINWYCYDSWTSWLILKKRCRFACCTDICLEVLARIALIHFWFGSDWAIVILEFSMRDIEKMRKTYCICIDLAAYRAMDNCWQHSYPLWRLWRICLTLCLIPVNLSHSPHSHHLNLQTMTSTVLPMRKIAERYSSEDAFYVLFERKNVFLVTRI